MPKIIENLENRLLEEARKQMEAVGYSAMTVRSVAKACGVGVGTVYNYYPSKDELIATFMLMDWNRCVETFWAVSADSDSHLPVVRCIYDQILHSVRLHSKLFREKTEAAAFAGSFSSYHGLLRSQLAQPLRRFCSCDFAADFIAEALLTWTVRGKSFEEIYSMIGKLFE